MRNDNAYAGRPSVCRQCGALVGAGEGSCGVCGAPAGASAAGRGAGGQAPASPPDPETLRFIRAVISRPATFTFVFLTANIFLFLLVTLSGGSQDKDVLVAYGAKVNRRIDGGEWWRFVTPIFLHGNPVHLLVNMYGLFVLGPYVEKLYGSAKFVVFWVLTGICGVVASYLFRAGDNPSVGASGALFGLVGVLFVFGLKFRHELPEGFKRAFGTGMLPTIAINLFIGFTIPFIDNAAHLGGLVSGALLALFVGYKRPGERARVAYAWHLLQAASLAAVVLSFGMAARSFAGPAPRLGNFRAARPPDPEGLRSYIEAINGSGPAVSKALDAAPRFDDEEARLREELKQILVRARDLGSAKPEARPDAKQTEALKEEYEGWSKRFDEWVSAQGESFGLGHKESPTPGDGEGEK